MGSYPRRVAAVAAVAMLAPAPAAAQPGDDYRPSSDFRLDRNTPTSQLVARRDGFLTGRSERRPIAVALDYLSDKREALGLDREDLSRLELVRGYRSGSGAVHLQWAQTYRGIPAFGAGLRANVDDSGRLINVGGEPLPDFEVAAVEPELSALDALLAAGRGAGVTVVPGRRGAAVGTERRTSFSGGHDASLTLFVDAERVRLAWRVLLWADDRRVYDAVVDAADGETLYRADLVRHAAAMAFDNYPGAPVGGSQAPKVFSETGTDPWLTSTTRLFGNNAHVYSDPNDTIQQVPPDPPGPPTSGDEIPPSAWNLPHLADPDPETQLGQDCPPVGCSWSNFDTDFSWRVNRGQAGTQLFYFVNRYHDHLRDAPGIGFGDSSGNFEQADRVLAQVDDGASTEITPPFGDYPACEYINNASAIPTPDGQPLLLQIYLWSSACTGGNPLVHDVNAADDALIVYHEYTHGLTNRLVTDAAGFGALTGPQSWAMDEGLSDWYALDLLNAEGFEPDSPAPGELRAGKYVNDAIRTQPFDCPVGAVGPACPGAGSAGGGGYTYGDFGKIAEEGPEVHADGEIWAETLWDLRTRLIADHGPAEGIARARALITDGMRLSPAGPSFLNMRDAILQADANRGLRDRDRIWAVFAARGMGEDASTTGDNDTSPVEGFRAPPPLPPPAPPAPTPTPDTRAPSISSFSMSRRRFRVGASRTPRAARRARPGSAFRFRLSERATVRIVLERARPGRIVGRRCRPAARRLRGRRRCTRYVAAGTLVRLDLAAGRRSVSFSGRIGTRPLRRGRHRAAISATDAAGNRSRKRKLTFTIVRR